MCKWYFVSAAAKEEEPEFTLTDGVEVFSNFDKMALKEDLLRGIYAYGNMI